MNGARDFEADAFIDEMQSQHAHSVAICHDVSHCLGTCDPKQQAEIPAKLVNALARLQEQLGLRFAREEQGGYLEEAACRLPRLQEEVARILTEHTELLQRLEGLTAEVRVIARQGKNCPRSLTSRIKGLVEQLAQHESAEREVVQQGFSIRFEECP